MEFETLNEIREADLSARSAEIVVDGQSLLIGHIHIHSVEPILDVRMSSEHGRAIGTIELGEEQWPVFAIDGDLNILASVPATRRACVQLKSEHGGIALLCDEVRVINNETLTMVPVPGCMGGEDGLMDSLAVMNGKVTCVLSAERLSLILRSQTTVDAAPAASHAAGER